MLADPGSGVLSFRKRHLLKELWRKPQARIVFNLSVWLKRCDVYYGARRDGW